VIGTFDVVHCGDVEVRAVYRLDMRDDSGPWRALIAARP
jgi:hypothetical protein